MLHILELTCRRAGGRLSCRAPFTVTTGHSQSFPAHCQCPSPTSLTSFPIDSEAERDSEVTGSREGGQGEPDSESERLARMVTVSNPGRRGPGPGPGCGPGQPEKIHHRESSLCDGVTEFGAGEELSGLSQAQGWVRWQPRSVTVGRGHSSYRDRPAWAYQ